MSLTSNIQASSSVLGNYLQGVQHFGVTVDDMAKSIEFYIDILGGRIAMSGDGFVGDVLHNTMFQKEDLEAMELGIDPREFGVPDVRDGSKEALDVRFISFGNTVVELIQMPQMQLISFLAVLAMQTHLIFLFMSRMTWI
jgi:catechol 2,3-dioxygenase-like lactoylglutathione lyase family enzyme